MFGDILADKCGDAADCRQLGFDLRYSTEDGVVKASITVNPQINDDYPVCR